MNSTYDMCNNAAYNTDRTCVLTCPTYFYFKVYRSVASSSYLSVNYGLYSPLIVATS